MVKKLVFVLLTIGCTYNTKTADSADAIFQTLESSISQDYIQSLKSTPDSDVIKLYYSSFVGKYIMATEKSMKINRFFYLYKINNPKDQAYISLIAWHRKLNQKPIDIESLIQEIIDREKNIIACLRKKKENALNNYKSMIQGDTITIPFPVRNSEDNLRSTIYYDCPTYHWDFKKDTDLEIKGKVVKKFYRESPQEYFIEIQVLNLSDLNTMFFFNRININDTIRVNLNLYGNRI